MTRSAASVAFLQDLLQSAMDQGRGLVDRAMGLATDGRANQQSLTDQLRSLLSGRGEASGVAIAREVMLRYRTLNARERSAFLADMNTVFTPDPEFIRQAYRAFDQTPSAANLQKLTEAVEPPRQELIRRLNQAPGNTLELVRMREDVLDRLKEQPELAALDHDFIHLFSSWFNRGFLVIKRIDWTTSAHILEKIIRYEAVHAIESWDDLRRRLEPADRRCFAFFHPALLDEPLIFVEVALTASIPDAINPILAADRKPLSLSEATTAVFYSISNCQRGLARVSFGNFLIKQVAEELKRELPGLTTFATLSPVPGFRRWLKDERTQAQLSVAERQMLEALLLHETPGKPALDAASPVLGPLLARYMLQAKTVQGQPADPVARFHLGNGARLERLNLAADLSPRGLADSFGAMVNYLYDLPMVESNHERYADKGEIVASQSVQRILRNGPGKN